MADAYVQVRPDDSGKKVQTFESTIGGQVVEAQATVEVSPTTGAAIGPATAAAQTAGNASLASIDGKLANPMPVSMASAPLASGAARDQTLMDDGQITEQLIYATLAAQYSTARLQSLASGQAAFLPEIPAFLGGF